MKYSPVLSGLNPFEIRAGLKPEKAKAQLVLNRLNPFEIRAGLKPCEGWQFETATGS